MFPVSRMCPLFQAVCPLLQHVPGVLILCVVDNLLLY